MKKASYLLLSVATIVWTISGCGGSPPGTTEQPVAAAGPPTANPPATGGAAASGEGGGPSAAAVVLPVTPASSPQDVVMAFLNGMRDGNSGVTAGLLTDKAQEETVKHNWPVQPPGAPSATYALGDPAFLDSQQTAAQVPCVWSESDGNGGKIEFQVAWMLRRQPQGWRVAGFASEVVPGQPAYFFNFEDIANLKAAQAHAEEALAAAANPPAGVPASVAEKTSTEASRR